MAIYQASKELTKFIISGLLAVLVDFIVYFLLSQFLDMNLSKALSFMSGMLVTYNLNKYWTWRQPDKNNKRLLLFVALYAVAMIVNVFSNQLAFNTLPNNEFICSIRNSEAVLKDLITVKIDKVLAFIIATGISATLTFLGQKFWLFKVKD
jgi:putative flippase GtrA